MFNNNLHVLALEIENKSKTDNLFIYFPGTDFFFSIHRQFINFAKSLAIWYMPPPPTPGYQIVNAV